MYLSGRRREASRLYSAGNDPDLTPRDVVKYESIDATYKHGILNMQFPKKEGAQFGYQRPYSLDN